MPFPPWFAGQVITAEHLNARNMRFVEQLNDQETTNNGPSWVLFEIGLDLEPNAVHFYWPDAPYSAGNRCPAWSWSPTSVPLAAVASTILGRHE